MWMSITCNDDTQLLKLCPDQSCCNSICGIVLSQGIFDSRLNMGLMNRPSYSMPLDKGPMKKNSFFYKRYIYATTLLITLAAFLHISTYGVHTQIWLIGNLSHWSKVLLYQYHSHSTCFSLQNLRFFLFFWFCSSILIQLNHGLSVGTEFHFYL